MRRMAWQALVKCVADDAAGTGTLLCVIELAVPKLSLAMVWLMLNRLVWKGIRSCTCMLPRRRA